MEWQRILHERGWAAPAWPVEYGGCDWSLTQHYIFSRESTLAGAPSLSPMGIRMVAHAIIAFGTRRAEGLLPAPHPDRRGVLLPGLLRTRGRAPTWRRCRWRRSTTATTWCAPAARSGRRTPARRTGCSRLVRTSRTQKKQQGITFVLIDMTSPGIQIRPLVMTSGEEIQNQVFFDEVRVPKTNVLGEIDDGWTVAKYLLEFERGGGASSPALQVMAEEIATRRRRPTRARRRPADRRSGVRAQARRRPHPHRGARDPRVPGAGRAGRAAGIPGAASSMLKVLATELSQTLTELAMEAAGPRGRAYQPHATRPGGPVAEFEPPAGRLRQRRAVAGGRAAALLQRPRRLDLRRQQRDSAQHPRQSGIWGCRWTSTLSKEQELLRDGLTSSSPTRYDLEKSRAAAKTGAGWQPDIWRGFADELGILGAALPEDVGGIGGGPVETHGHRRGARSCAGGRALRRHRRRRRRACCTGRAARRRRRCWRRSSPGTRDRRACRGGGGVRRSLAGRRRPPPTATATAGCCTAQDRGDERAAGHPSVGHGAHAAAGISLFLVDVDSVERGHRDAPLSHRRRPPRGGSGVRRSAAARGRAARRGGPGWPSLAQARDEGAAAICAEAVGCMRKVLADTVEYCKQRQQFGAADRQFPGAAAPHGRHVHGARAGRRRGYLAVLNLDAEPATRARAVSAAKATVGRAARFIGQHAVQLHGGMGMTEELAIGHYFKRLTAMQYEFGSTDHHIGRYAELTRPTR